MSYDDFVLRYAYRCDVARIEASNERYEREERERQAALDAKFREGVDAIKERFGGAVAAVKSAVDTNFGGGENGDEGGEGIEEEFRVALRAKEMEIEALHEALVEMENSNKQQQQQQRNTSDSTPPGGTVTTGVSASNSAASSDELLNLNLLKEENAKLKREMANHPASLDALKSELQSHLADHQQTVASHQQNVAAHESAMRLLKESSASAGAESSAREEEVGQLRAQLAVAATTRSELEAMLAEITNQAPPAEDAEAIDAREASHAAEIKLLTATLEEMKASLSVKSVDASAHDDLKRQHAAEIEELNAKLVERENKPPPAPDTKDFDEIAMLKTTIAELQNAKPDTSALDALRASSADEIAMLKTTISAIRNAVPDTSALDALRASSADEIAMLKTTISAIQNAAPDMSALDALRASSAAEIAQLNATIASLENAAPDTAALDSLKASHAVELDQWKGRAEKCRNDRTTVVKEKKEIEAKLTQSLASVTAELEAARREVVSLYAKVSTLEEDKGSEASSGVLVSSTDNLKGQTADGEEGDGWGGEGDGWGE